MGAPAPQRADSPDSATASSASLWLELCVHTDTETAEAVGRVFSAHSASGAIIEQIVSGPNEPRSTHVTVKTSLSLNDTAARDRIEEALWHLGQIHGISPLEIEKRVLKPEDWAEARKRDYAIQHIGERFAIVPSWIEYVPRSDEIAITLDPGLAFGTGLHPSTRLTLQAMGRIWDTIMTVLDVGTGSGILSIAAAKMGAPSVLAVDIDPVAVRIARENVELNGVMDRVRVQPGTIEVASEGLCIRSPRTGSGAANLRQDVPGAFFDLVLANIIAEIIIELAGPLSASLRPGGRLIVSGIMRDRTPAVEGALSAVNIQIMDQLKDEDWVALIGIKGEG